MDDNLGPLLKVHERHASVEMARRELYWLLDWRKKYELTLAEELMLLSEWIYHAMGRCVKSEREKENES